MQPSCRSCKSANGQTIRAEKVFGGNSSNKFWHCNNCDLVYLWPIPSEEDEKHFYEKEFEAFMAKRDSYKKWDIPAIHNRENQGNVERRSKFIEKYLDAGKKILEIGCSSGFMLDYFKKKGLITVAVEPSELYSRYLIDNGHKVYSDLEEIVKGEDELKFDLIVHFFVLEHIRDTKQFIEDQLNLLNPGGVIIAEVPCVNDPLTSLYDIKAFEEFYWSIAHHYYFNPNSLSFILENIDCSYKFVPEQRYDLSNHLFWMQYGKPGGQGKYSQIFSKETLNSYTEDLKNNWACDTFYVYIWK